LSLSESSIVRITLVTALHSAQWVALKARLQLLASVAHFPGRGIIQSPWAVRMKLVAQLIHNKEFGSVPVQLGGRLQP